VSDGLDHEDGVAPVDSGQGVAEADGGSGGDAGSQFEHVPFPAAAVQQAVVESRDRGLPVDRAIRMAPWPASSAVVMNWLVKSSRCSQLPQLLSRLTAASAVRMPLARRPGPGSGSHGS
jgi:hypothetical protein